MTFTLLQLITACCISAAIPAVCLAAYFRREISKVLEFWGDVPIPWPVVLGEEADDDV